MRQRNISLQRIVLGLMFVLVIGVAIYPAQTSADPPVGSVEYGEDSAPNTGRNGDHGGGSGGGFSADPDAFQIDIDAMPDVERVSSGATRSPGHATDWIRWVNTALALRFWFGL